MFRELWELLRSGAIHRHQLGSKYPFDPNIMIYRKLHPVKQEALREDAVGHALHDVHLAARMPRHS